ncbi:MAG: hypothetical protein ACW981_19405 [Candidatus Hodarchaeales archaeon]
MALHILILFRLLIFLIIRLFGVYKSISLYKENRNTIFLEILLGWLFLTLSGIIPIVLVFEDNEVLFSNISVFNNYFFTLGTLFILGGFLSYFLFVSKKLILYTYVVTIITPIIFWLANLNTLSEIISSVLLFYIIFLLLYYVVRMNKEIKNVIGNSINYIYLSIIIGLSYIPLAIFTLLVEENFSLYRSTNDFVIGIY